MGKIFILLIVGLVLLSGCVSGGNNQSGNQAQLAYDDDWFSIEYPQSWAYQNLPQGGIKFGSGQVGVTVAIAPFPEQTTFDDYNSVSVQGLRNGIDGFSLLNSGASYLSGRQAYRVEFTGKVSNQDFKFIQVWAEKDGYAYVVSYSSPPQNFEGDIDTFNTMLQSFVIKDRPTTPVASSWSEYNTDFGISLEHPSDWGELDLTSQQPDYDAYVAFLSPENPNDKNIALIISSKSFDNRFNQDIKPFAPDAQVAGRQTVTVSGMQGEKITYTYTSPTSMKLAKTIELVVEVDGKFYTVFYAAPVDSFIEADAQKALDSVKIAQQASTGVLSGEKITSSDGSRECNADVPEGWEKKDDNEAKTEGDSVLLNLQASESYGMPLESEPNFYGNLDKNDVYKINPIILSGKEMVEVETSTYGQPTKLFAFRGSGDSLCLIQYVATSQDLYQKHLSEAESAIATISAKGNELPAYKTVDPTTKLQGANSGNSDMIKVLAGTSKYKLKITYNAGLPAVEPSGIRFLNVPSLFMKEGNSHTIEIDLSGFPVKNGYLLAYVLELDAAYSGDYIAELIPL